MNFLQCKVRRVACQKEAELEGSTDIEKQGVWGERGLNHLVTGNSHCVGSSNMFIAASGDLSEAFLCWGRWRVSPQKRG